MSLSFQKFLEVDIRVGTINKAELTTKNIKPAIKVWIDFGTRIGIKKSSAQITKYYSPSKLIGRQVTAVINLPPRQISTFMSEVLILGFPDSNGEVSLLIPDIEVPNGGRLF